MASEGPQAPGTVTVTWRQQNQQLVSVETEVHGVNILQRPKALDKMSRTCPGSGGTSQAPGTGFQLTTAPQGGVALQVPPETCPKRLRSLPQFTKPLRS